MSYTMSTVTEDVDVSDRQAVGCLALIFLGGLIMAGLKVLAYFYVITNIGG